MDDEELRQECLDAVLLICNEPRFRELLEMFHKVDGHEDGIYSPFAEVFNYALQRLSGLQLPHLRPSSNFNILLHVNDPRQIAGHNCSARIPDINIVSNCGSGSASIHTSGSRTHMDIATSDLKATDLRNHISRVRRGGWPYWRSAPTVSSSGADTAAGRFGFRARENSKRKKAQQDSPSSLAIRDAIV